MFTPHPAFPKMGVGDSDSSKQDLDNATIAKLGCDEISRMTCEELVRVIRGSRLPLIDAERDRHLPNYGRDTLERLTYFARWCCQNRQGR